MANIITGIRILCGVALPLAIRFLEFRYAAAVVCAVATIAAVQECLLIISHGPLRPFNVIVLHHVI